MYETETADGIDRVRSANFERPESRPRSRTVAERPKQSTEVRRAKTRLRTAAWRCALDKRKSPESDVVAMALLAAVVTAKRSEIDTGSLSIVQAAFHDLTARGFERSEIEGVFRRFRSSLRKTPPVER